MEHFNQLSPSQDERLACLLEEMGEVIQIIGKIQRHGYRSYHPDNLAESNRDLLMQELGHVCWAMEQMEFANDISPEQVSIECRHKSEKVGQYLHPQ